MLGSLVAGIAVVLGVVFFLTQPVFSRGLAVAMPSLAFLFMAAGRWVLRAPCATAGTACRQHGAAPALIYGAGDAGHQVARLVDTADEPPYRIVGFIDDDLNKRFLRVRGHRVLGRGPTSSTWPERRAPRWSSSRSARPSRSSSRPWPTQCSAGRASSSSSCHRSAR